MVDDKPKPPEERVAGYKPELLLKAPAQPPLTSEVLDTQSIERPRQIRRNHNVFGLFLLVAGVGLLAIIMLAMLFLPEVAPSIMTTLGIVGVAAIVVGLMIDTIYRLSYRKNN